MAKRKVARAITDLSTVRLVKTAKTGKKPMPVNDPVFLSILREAVNSK